jgi:hypothetical protein
MMRGNDVTALLVTFAIRAAAGAVDVETIAAVLGGDSGRVLVLVLVLVLLNDVD